MMIDTELTNHFLQNSIDRLVIASRNTVSQCREFRDEVVHVDYELIVELRKALAEYAVATATKKEVQ